MMSDLAERYPGYGWERNAGYGTKGHREAILRLGGDARIGEVLPRSEKLLLDMGSVWPADSIY